MKRTHLIISLLLIGSVFPLFSQTGKIDEETFSRVTAWENRMNEERQPPEKVMDIMGLKPGMVIGEVGAGRGRFTVHLARRVGDSGRIYANDISEDALEFLRFRCDRDDIRNIEIIMGEEEDPLLPENSLDMIFMVWVFHMLEKPVPLMKNMIPSLKPGALLIILAPPDYEIDEEIKEMEGKLPPDRLTIRQRIEKAAADSGFELVKTDGSLPKDTFFFLKAKSS
jgi:ubiquinone/menaquinone biosynthesis C-methylase UbiE